MSLRTRLIVAFLLISVLPLTAVTGYGYYSSSRAMRRAVQAEAGALAAELGHRMELVTTDLERRVDRLWDVPMAPGTPEAEAVPAASGTTGGIPAEIAVLLGGAAAWLDRLEILPAVEAAPKVTPPGGSPPAPPVPPVPRAPRAGEAPPPPPVPPKPIVVDLNAVIAEATKNDPEARQAAELAQRWLERLQIDLTPAVEAGLRGTAAGLRLGAEELERLAAQKRGTVDEKRRLLTARKGSRLDFQVMRDGAVVGRVNAKVNLDRLLGSVLAMSQSDQGEVAFAIDADHNLYTPRAEDRARLEGLDLEGAGPGEGANASWIVVTRDDPSGVRFGIARPIGASLAEIRRAAVRNLGLGMLVIVIALAGVFPLSTHMTRNLSTLTAGANRIAAGDLDTRVPVRSRDEFGQLAQAFNRMTGDLQAHQKMLVEQERLQRELELCRQIQNEMLPHGALRLGLTEVKGVSIPAREVGGDFFNYFLLPDGQMALLVGDVSGKGVGAALLMANIQATLRARLPLEHDLAALADAIDREVEHNTPRGVYVTLFVGILDPQPQTLRYVNAGHNPQFVLRASGEIDRLQGTGMPVGLFAGHGYQERCIQLEDDDLLFFYTDGLVEAENEAREMFGAERLEALIVRSRNESVADTLARIERAVSDFRGAAEPFDDATMMALRLTGPERAQT